jgi:ABC-2 type transport system ATP-binding protein
VSASQPDSHDAAVSTTQLRKWFRNGREKVEAVSGIDLTVHPGEIFGFLGPNGAGKTTTLRMLTTLLPIDAGEAFVAGVDVRREPQEVRRRIGYVGQLGGTDLPATGRENLVLQGSLYGASRGEAERRAAELIDSLELSGFADRIARTYSGGQRRRLEVALGIMHRPDVLFLDEPTTGLDPQNRANLWEQLRALRGAGTTIFLTTHYLEEAQALADRVAIVKDGRVLAIGPPRELGVGAARYRVAYRDGSGKLIETETDDPTTVLHEATGRALERGERLSDLSVGRPTLEDVYLELTSDV